MRKKLLNNIGKALIAAVMLLPLNSVAQGYYNLQHPASGSIAETESLTTYAQVYQAGATEAAGQAAGMQAWIGISPKGQNTNPDTWTNWVPATFNVQVGNNDEFMAAIGSNLAPGTYYYASRFQYNNGAFVYGGYSGGAWNGTSNVSGVLTVSSNPACTTVWYADADGDGYGDIANTITGCNQPQGYVSNSNDCNDANPNLYNNADLYVDNDGDGYSEGAAADTCYGATVPSGYVMLPLGADCNDNDATKWRIASMYLDNDDDGYYGDIQDNICYGNTVPEGYSLSTNGTDCNDNNPAVYNNIDAFVDEDGDGYTEGAAADICYGDTLPAGYSTTSLGADCNDTDASLWHPADMYVDNDGDGYHSDNVDQVCYGDTVPAGYSLTTNGLDCDDTNAALFNHADLYIDADGDGYDNGMSADYCYGAETPAGYSVTTAGEDCDDTKASVNPGADEIFDNGIDENCNGMEDDATPGEFVTQLKASQCGATLPRIYTALVAVAQIPNVTGYRWAIRDLSKNQTQIIETDVNYVQLNDLAEYEYGTTYSVKIELEMNGTYVGYYGPACTVTTPSLFSGPVAITIPQCGTTLAQRNTAIFVTGPHFIESYQVRVTNLTTSEQAVLTRTGSWFTLKMLPALYDYDTDYSIEVRVRTTATGQYSNWTTACTVSTPAAPVNVTSGNTTVAAAFRAVAYPNPYVDSFTVNFASDAATRVQVKVYDMLGHQLEVRDVEPSNLEAQRLGTNYPSGIYNVVVTQGDVTKSIRVIKR